MKVSLCLATSAVCLFFLCRGCLQDHFDQLVFYGIHISGSFDWINSIALSAEQAKVHSAYLVVVALLITSVMSLRTIMNSRGPRMNLGHSY